MFFVLLYRPKAFSAGFSNQGAVGGTAGLFGADGALALPRTEGALPGGVPKTNQD